MNYVHTPVMLHESLDILGPRGDNELMIDGNTGEGGHSFNFLQKFPDLHLVCVDADGEILEIAKKRLAVFGSRVQFYNCWSHDFFADYPAGLNRPNTIMFDLGVSLYHYKDAGRGFSFEKDEPLDMRLDTSCGTTAAEIIAKLPERELADLIYNNADERYSRRIAAKIANERQHRTITTTSALAELVKDAVPAKYRHGRIHPATRTFQALRIAVNGELSKLPSLLEAALGVLKPGGRLGVISFHSLEDRIIKNFFRLKNKDCTCPENAPMCKCEGMRQVNILTKKGITPSVAEIEQNPPSTSARLRVVEKVRDEVGQ